MDKYWNRLKANTVQIKIVSLDKGAVEVMVKGKNLWCN